MDRQVGVDLGIVACVAIDIWCEQSGKCYRVRLTSRALWCYCTELDTKTVAGLFEMLQCVAISTDATELLSTTIGKTASKAEPEIGSEVARGALGGDWVSVPVLIVRRSTYLDQE